MGGASAWLLSAGLPLILLALSLPVWHWRWPRAPVLLREAALVSTVFLIWQIPARMSAGNLEPALDRARWIYRWEQRLRLPDEVDWQQAVLPHPWLVQAANFYYAVMHFGAMAALLVWLFWRHRDSYGRVRTYVVLVTVVSLLIQLVAVAPPRLLTRLGFADTAERYGQSVYGSGPGSVVADELSAVPSVHVAWAVLVAAVVIRLGHRRWRWLVVAHPLLTLAVIVVTANHFWLDAAAAVAVLAVCALLQWSVRACAHRIGRAVRRTPVSADSPACGNGDPSGPPEGSDGSRNTEGGNRASRGPHPRG
ncbi:phosphatase PAP2 family protein [Streptomyces sp. WMMB303]|uniref:phosphatase PAP2 family protein n=1 Tax=Streptomyces sp. WMMB303 TaxID=3034154 RepID=UPI0023EB5A4A|nr:phosphatase PAP2 family protein [Streptomyces sp. WMMB303]MDF4252019.1 phosphatase PAP2 family protein [Streptomyces sp. WMMB303]